MYVYDPTDRRDELSWQQHTTHPFQMGHWNIFYYYTDRDSNHQGKWDWFFLFILDPYNVWSFFWIQDQKKLLNQVTLKVLVR
jgi:hypothetical protein